MSLNNEWSKCNICKKSIQLNAQYYLCSVSTCKHPRTGLKFCSVDCWDTHIGETRHRDAWAEEARAPKVASTSEDNSQVRAPVRKIYDTKPTEASSSSNLSSNPSAFTNLDTLVVVSKVKQFIKDNSEFNTSQCLIDEISKKVAEISLRAIQSAKESGRKTVMGRDVK